MSYCQIFPSGRHRPGNSTRHDLRTAAVIAVLVLLGACSLAPVSTPQVDDAAVARYRLAGYPIAAAGTIAVHRISGPVSGAPWSISITRPGDSVSRPIIIYLPGLGEADDVPSQWIGTWARAGYAVIAVQALREDAEVWATPEARSGDFERVARARFSDELMGDRLIRLSALLTQVRARSERAEPGLEGLDWSHVALAGADLGAYTVQSIAAPAQRAAIAWPFTPLAFIAISPYAVRGGTSFSLAGDGGLPAAGAAAGSHAPVLMISSRDDIDAYGVTTDTGLRRLAFDRLGNGDDYYLELGLATHRWLSGVVRSSTGAEAGAPRRAVAPPEDPKSRRRPGGANAGARDAMAPGSDEDDTSPEKVARGAAARVAAEKERSGTMTRVALTAVSLEAVSVAFVDAYLRQQAPARSWLADAAGRWLQEGDRLKHR